MEQEIQKLLSCEVKEISFKTFCKDLFGYLKKIGIETGIEDVNSWEGYYWSEFEHDGKKYSISGCMYDGSVGIGIIEE
ncbi:MAG: hypothetical protein ACRCTZ_18330 [Sarcina sp.]